MTVLRRAEETPAASKKEPLPSPGPPDIMIDDCLPTFDAPTSTSAFPHSVEAPFGTSGTLIDCFFRYQCGETSVMTWKFALLVLASAAMLVSTPASARFYRHSHYHSHHHFFHGGGQRYYSNPSAPGGGMLSPSAAWNH